MWIQDSIASEMKFFGLSDIIHQVSAGVNQLMLRRVATRVQQEPWILICCGDSLS